MTWFIVASVAMAFHCVCECGAVQWVDDLHNLLRFGLINGPFFTALPVAYTRNCVWARARKNDTRSTHLQACCHPNGERSEHQQHIAYHFDRALIVPQALTPVCRNTIMRTFSSIRTFLFHCPSPVHSLCRASFAFAVYVCARAPSLMFY